MKIVTCGGAAKEFPRATPGPFWKGTDDVPVVFRKKGGSMGLFCLLRTAAKLALAVGLTLLLLLVRVNSQGAHFQEQPKT
jgi:hypothetical protein